MRNPWFLRLAFLSLAALSVALTQTTPQAAKGRWYKGNLHTHTLNSDGDSSPNDVAAWYREHGYNFLVLSDHNRLAEIADLKSAPASKEPFLLKRLPE